MENHLKPESARKFIILPFLKIVNVRQNPKKVHVKTRPIRQFLQEIASSNTTGDINRDSFQNNSVAMT